MANKKPLIHTGSAAKTFLDSLPLVENVSILSIILIYVKCFFTFLHFC